MPIEYRDWYRNWFFRGNHPPTCTCAECTRKRLGKPEQTGSSPQDYLTPTTLSCPICSKTLYYDIGNLMYRCKNPDCKRVYTQKDLFPEKEEKPQEETPDSIEVKPYAEPVKTTGPVRQVVTEAHGGANDVKRETIDLFIAKLLYRKNSWDVSILDLVIVSLAIFVMLLLHSSF